MSQPKTNPELYEKVETYLVELMKEAPEFGSCNLDVTFHAGKLVKVIKTIGISVKPEEKLLG
jgi:hypothetical protein